MLSIIVPAHNEASVIARCLGAITGGARADEMEVIVVCNGCSDNTASVARERGAKVIETDVPSKSNALNLGDETASGFPRFYVDADVVISTDSIRRIAARLQSGGVLAAAPRIEMDLGRSSWAVRAFYEIDARLPSYHVGIGGSGVYALSATGRARFERFPLITADDGFIRRQFAAEERERVEDAYSLVTPPRTLSGLVTIKTRSHFGNYEIADWFPESSPSPGGGNARALLRLLKYVHLWPKLTIYAYVKLMARIRSAWRYRFGNHQAWERDETSRRVDDSSSISHGGVAATFQQQGY